MERYNKLCSNLNKEKMCIFILRAAGAIAQPGFKVGGHKECILPPPLAKLPPSHTLIYTVKTAFL